MYLLQSYLFNTVYVDLFNTLLTFFLAQFNLVSAQNVLLQPCNIPRTSPEHYVYYIYDTQHDTTPDLHQFQ